MYRIEATPINPPGTIGYDPRRRSMQFASAERAKQVFDKWTADGWNVYRYGPLHGAPPCRGSFDNKPCIWFDSRADLELYGWRFAGFADEIVGRGIDHRGWFTDSDGDGEVYRGAVVLLPHGIACPAVYDSCSDGIAVFLGSGFWLSADNPDDNATRSHHDTAARHADSIAEHAAEHERDYQEKWQRAANLADRLDELTKLGQFADGSRLNPWIESERETLLMLEALSREFMSPHVEKTKRGKYRARLSASGYLDCTDWGRPCKTIAQAYTELADLYGDGVETTELSDLDLIDDPDCAEHFPSIDERK